MNIKAKAGIAACALALAMMPLAACSSDLPDEDTGSESNTAAVAVASGSQTITTQGSSEKTVAPDTASLTVTLPLNIEVKEGETAPTADDMMKLLVDDGAAEESIEQSGTDAEAVFAVSDVNPRDARRIKQDAEEMGAKVSDIAWSVSDIGAVKTEAQKEAYADAQSNAEALAQALGYNINGLAGISDKGFEIVAANENEVTVKVIIEVSANISKAK